MLTSRNVVTVSANFTLLGIELQRIDAATDKMRMKKTIGFSKASVLPRLYRVWRGFSDNLARLKKKKISMHLYYNGDIGDRLVLQ